VHAHVQSVIASIAPNDSVERFTALGVKVIKAEAKFHDRDTVVAGGYEIRARRFVIATGSSPLVPPIPGLDTVKYLTNETLFEQTKLPQHLVIIGGGPIGLEMAQAHRRLGAKVTVLEALKAFGKDDPELAAVVIERLRAEGIDIREGAKVTAVEKRGTVGITVKIETDSVAAEVKGTHLLVAAGRAANVNGLDLEKAGIKYDKRGIKVGADLRTSNRKVYAIGDVTGGLQFTHVAGYHGGLLLRPLLFRLPARENRAIVPWVTYTDPELAQVGMSEADAGKAHRKLSVLRWPYAENDRAQTERKTSGFIKVVVTRKGKILGASIVGAGAGEMVNIWALALSKGMTVRDMTGYIPPYPTMTEIGKRAAVSFYAPATRKPLLRKAIAFLRRFG
jgi:pyruvate/2-oxoglutarate dehydrogenase complex dihydrolipoamide dehydrogenase (E3) component